nr:hypothetical protein [Spirochaetota bacterium]
MKGYNSIIVVLLVYALFSGCATQQKKVGCIEGKCDEGYGVYVWEDGTMYAGNFKSGKFYGQGTYT